MYNVYRLNDPILYRCSNSPKCSKDFNSVQFSRSVMSDSVQPHESQQARPPCPSPSPGVHSDSRPSSQWCHPAISSSVVSFSSCPQSLPASESFPVSQLFTWGGQSTGVWLKVNSNQNFNMGVGDKLENLIMTQNMIYRWEQRARITRHSSRIKEDLLTRWELL